MLIDQQGVHFELNKKSFTAKIIASKEAKGNVFIPFSVIDDFKEYIITNISEGAFKYSKIESLTIAEDSVISSIPGHVFENSTIKDLHLPASIEKLEEFWCFFTPNLINVTISSDNQKFLIQEQKILLGKTGENCDTFYFANRDIQTVFIPSTIKRINSCCFQNCSKLKSIQFSNDSKLEMIGKYSFANSSFEYLKIPKSVSHIDDHAFFICKNIQLIIFDSDSNLSFIGQSAFESSSISTITIPSKVKSIEENTFSYCKNLKKIEFLEESELKTIKSEAFSDSLIEVLNLPSQVENLEEYWCSGASKLKVIKISSRNKHLAIIDNNKLLIGKSSIENNQFDILYFACRDVVVAQIPSAIKRIGSCCFQNCKSLKTVQFPDDSKLEVIETSAFSCSSLESIKIPKHVSVISDYAFFWCQKIQSFIFESDSELNSIGKSAFESSSFTSLSVPKNVSVIGESAFYSCENLQAIQFDSDSELSFISKSAFELTSIINISIPNKVKSIEENTFSNCQNLKKIEFLEGSELTTIEPEAFSNMSKLQTIKINNQHFSTIGNKILIGKSNLSSENYDVLYFACRDIEDAVIPSTIKRINSRCFQNCQKLKSVQFSDDSELEIIDQYAFASSSLESIIIPKHVSVIDDHAFLSCKNIKFIEFEQNSELNSISKSAFESSSIATISIPRKVKLIKESSFASCENLKKIEFKEGSELKMIEQKAFSKTSNLQMIKIKNQNFYSIGDRILIGKSNFSNISFDVLYFASRGIDEIIIPSTIKQNDSSALSKNLQVNIIDIKEDSKLMIQSIWLDFPKKYKKELDRISNPIIHKIYDKFQFKYYVFNEIQDIENVIFNLFIYLVNFKFITFYIDKEKFNVNYKINCIFCIEGECIIIEEVVIDTLNNLIQKLVKHQISLINLSDSSIISMEPHNEAKEEVKKFCKQFIYEIMKNDFLNYTIKPIVGYLIRRYFYPSNYFRDKSFFNFEQVISNEQSIKTKIKQFLFDDNIFRFFDDIIEDTKIFEKQRNDIKNSTKMFNEEDFIILRDIYSKNDFGFII